MTPDKPGTLIIGASQAGLQFASSLRELGGTGRITLLGGETRAPYQRPPLSKSFLQGKLAEDGLALRGEAFYRESEIELVMGEWVDNVRLTDAATGEGEAVTRSGRHIAFDHLVLTVGGTPRRMTGPGHDLPGIHYLRDVDEALALRTDLEAAERVVVVGGGFVGLEVAAAATAAGKHVTVVEAADRLLGRTVAPVVSAFYLAAHRKRGTEVLLGAGVTGFAGGSRVSSVELSDGTSIPADVVAVGIGLVPHTQLAKQLGLECAGGIVVDEDGRTSIPTVFAAGDCTVLAHPDHGSLRLESVQNAIAQAKRGAAALLGVEAPETGVPWFWSDQADLKLQIAGLSTGYDDVVVRGIPDTESFSVLYYRDGRLVAIDAINNPRDYMAVRRILETGGDVPKTAAADVPLKSFIGSSA